MSRAYGGRRRPPWKAPAWGQCSAPPFAELKLQGTVYTLADQTGYLRILKCERCHTIFCDAGHMGRYWQM